MHLSMDTLGIVDDSCLDNYDIAKGAGSSGGGRVHSIDVILGFSKDQDPLLHSVGDDDSQKNNVENPSHPDKHHQSDPYGHLPELGDSSQHSSYHGESLRQKNICHFFNITQSPGDFNFKCPTSVIRAVVCLAESQKNTTCQTVFPPLS